jgi:hypothetical protein
MRDGPTAVMPTVQPIWVDYATFQDGALGRRDKRKAGLTLALRGFTTPLRPSQNFLDT